MTRLLSLITLGVLTISLLVGVLPTVAAETDVVITNRQVWRASPAQPLTSLAVHVGGELIIAPGVTVTFSPHAPILIQGVLVAEGTEESPIQFTAETDVLAWEGITVAAEGQFLAAWIQVRGSLNGLVFQGQAQSVNHLILQDNYHNRILIGQPNTKHTERYRFENIRFVRERSFPRTGDTGIDVYGPNADVWVKDAVFHENRLVHPDGLIGIRVNQPYTNITALNVTHRFGCSIEPIRGHYLSAALLGFRAGACGEPPLPVVFIPGFGSSINLEVLTTRDVTNPVLDNWRFLQPFTSAYVSLIDQLVARGVHVEVAYYDWRQEAHPLAHDYLLPSIARAKAATGSGAVNIVAHSYGGLIARAYIQSDEYVGDVTELVTLGTPHVGSPVAHAVWQAGVIPREWQSITTLLRWYAFQESQPSSLVKSIRQTIPSLSNLIPAYPFLLRNGVPIEPHTMRLKNDFLLTLNKAWPVLFDRVQVRAIAGLAASLPRYLAVGPAASKESWPDGKPLEAQPTTQIQADGTVPLFSALGEIGDVSIVDAGHLELVRGAVPQVLTHLYPTLTPQVIPEPRRTSDLLWFYFDCPIRVTVSVPHSTEVYSTEAPGGILSQGGELFQNSDMIWLGLPKQEGVYEVKITALANTLVRVWKEQGPIQAFHLNQGNTKRLQYSVGVEAAVSKLPLDEMSEREDGSGSDSGRSNTGSFAELIQVVVPRSLPPLPPLRYKSSRRTTPSFSAFCCGESSGKEDTGKHSSEKLAYGAAILAAVGISLLVLTRRWQK